MKGQQLFYSFLPGVTAAVLTTQPAVAQAMKVSSVQLASSPSVLTANDSQTLVGDNIQPQLPQTTAQVFPDIITNSDSSVVNSQILSSTSNPVILTDNTGIAKEQKFQKNEIKVVSLASQRNLVQKLKQQRLSSNQKPSSEPELVKTVVPMTTSKSQLSANQTVALSSLQHSVPQQSPKTQLPIAVQTAVKGAGAANLLAVNSCSLAQQNRTSLLVTSPACSKSYLISQQVSQTTAPTGETTSTAEVVEFAQDAPAPVETAPTPTEPATVTPVPGGAVQVPENLIPNPNPLQFPTKTEEVTVQGNQPISLAQALELAKRNNRDLQVAVLELERAQASLREAQAALYPNLSINTDISRSQSAVSQLQDEQSRRQGFPSNNDEPSTAFNGQAELRYDLFTSGRRRASIKEAEEQVRFSELAVESQSEDIRRNVSREYYDLQEADERVRIAQSAVENSQASLRDAEALERAGVGTRFDVLRSQVNLANAQQELTNALSRQQIFRRTLATRLSLPQTVNISAADPVQLAGLWQQSLEQSVILAYQNRPELQQQLAQRNISEQQRRQALSNLGPQVSFIANYNLLDQFDDGISLTDGYSVGVRASLNLFDGGAARARATQAKKNIAIFETRFAEQRNQIRFQVEQAFFTQQANLENVQTANTALEQARESLRLARLRFQAGVGTQTDVINAENELTRAEGNRITAILEYNRALADLQRAVTSRALL
ncbi:outer membrane protein [Nostoc sp. PCC 7524]|uniref:TolC family protein n=1 Tax=Nostoc sp. (strain ATCC 29411 / PCC 7524) TaxID=28072 RepID=UPI00029ECF9A|nr:TolC family protein [Nostoc sp. PCC 7524]AFY49582.1 outer membrane protein [Nostoc sp. PCC 7524]